MNLSNNLINILELIINKEKITKEKLANLGIDDIELINNNILIKENNEYNLKSIKELFAYSIYLISTKELDKAIICLEICHEIDPSNKEVILQLLQVSLKRKNYDKAFTAFSWLDKDIKNKQDNNLYLYLLSLICKYPEGYKERIIKMEYDDVVLNQETNPGINVANQNKMRISILQGKLQQATKIFNEFISNETKSITERYLMKELLESAKEQENKKRLAIISLVEDKDYKGIISLIERRKSVSKVNLYNSFIYYLAKKILIIEQTRIIPKIKVTDTNNLKEALLGDNYLLALRLNQERSNSLSDKEEINLVTILLKRINILINKIEEEQEKNLQHFNHIKDLLETGKDNEAIRLIKLYLKNINKSNYEYIVLNLIKINYLEKTTNFSNIVSTLVAISKPKSKINIEFYINSFYTSIKENKYSIAKIYYDIISKYIKENDINELPEEILKELNDIETIIEKIKEEEIFLETHLELLKQSEDPTIILTGITKERRELIIDLLTTNKNLTAFYIDSEEPKPLVLRYSEDTDNNLDKKELFNRGLRAYFEEDYNLSIKIHTLLLRTANYAKPKLYAILGFSYLKVNNIPQAVKYLTIANDLNRCSYDTTKAYKFTRLINLLKDDTKEDRESKIESYINRFNATLKNYDLEKLEEIAYYLKDNNLTIEQGIVSFGLSQNQTSIIKLILARHCYLEGLYQYGDILLQEVEETKQKNKTVESLLADVKTKRK